jgi:hypothetical protein
MFAAVIWIVTIPLPARHYNLRALPRRYSWAKNHSFPAAEPQELPAFRGREINMYQTSVFVQRTVVVLKVLVTLSGHGPLILGHFMNRQSSGARLLSKMPLRRA